MATTIVDIEKSQMDFNQGGSLWSEHLVFAGAGDPTIVILPVAALAALAVQGVGVEPTVEATIYPRSMVEAGTASWVAWDGSAGMNLALVALRITPVGAATVVVTARTYKN